MIWARVGAILMFLGVGLGAFGAHALQRRLTPDMLTIFETGVRYHFVHALGLFVVGRLPKTSLDAAYDKRFSAEEFGIAIQCEARDVAELDSLLRDYEAKEVSLVEA